MSVEVTALAGQGGGGQVEGGVVVFQIGIVGGVEGGDFFGSVDDVEPFLGRHSRRHGIVRGRFGVFKYEVSISLFILLELEGDESLFAFSAYGTDNPLSNPLAICRA